jgi:hypothetical protein
VSADLLTSRAALIGAAAILAPMFQDRMLAQGVKVGRPFEGYDTRARVTIGRHQDVDRFLRALPRALSDSSQNPASAR